MVANIKMNKYCAFCQSWYNPTNDGIKPIDPAQGIWEFETNIEKQCMNLRCNKPAFASCNKYVPKL